MPKNNATMIAVPPASPFSPSMKLKALVSPMIQSAVKG